MPVTLDTFASGIILTYTNGDTGMNTKISKIFLLDFIKAVVRQSMDAWKHV